MSQSASTRSAAGRLTVRAVADQQGDYESIRSIAAPQHRSTAAPRHRGSRQSAVGSAGYSFSFRAEIPDGPGGRTRELRLMRTVPMADHLHARTMRGFFEGDPPVFAGITPRVSAPVRLNRRVEGDAQGFETWDDALTVRFPRLMAGAIRKKYGFPPIAAGIWPSAGGKAAACSDCASRAATSLSMPNSFRMYVTGVLEKGKGAATIGLGPLQSAIDAPHRTAWPP